MEILKLKSICMEACAFEDIDISRFAIPLTMNPDRYAEDLARFLRCYAHKETVPDVQDQDMVRLCCKSDVKKFDKPEITLRIGLGLYSKELETAVIGMHVGETQEILTAQGPVTVTILASTREVLPEVSDQLARSVKIPEIRTAEDIRIYCRYMQYDEILEDAADEAFSYFSGILLQQSQFLLDQEELEASLTLTKSTMHPIDPAAYDEPDSVDMSRLASQIAESTLKAAVYGNTLTTFTDEDYHAYLAKRATALDLPVEMIRQKEPPVSYMITAYSDFFLDLTERYTLRKLKALGEAMT